MNINMYGFVFEEKELNTPILNYYFKKVTVDFFTHMVITHTRKKLGLR